MPTPAPTPITTSYWCYSCTRFVSVWTERDTAGEGVAGGVSCPYCDGGFIEEIEESVAPAGVRSVNHSLRSMVRRRRSGRRPSFNPVIVLQGSGERDEGEVGNGARDSRAFEFYYDDGSGAGLRPLPDSVSEILMGSGFERLLEQLGQIEATTAGIARSENPPASKSAIESMPRIEISGCHVSADTHCAVCTEAFELRAEAREMPCKHIFHGDCILPWLSIRNSCPICRFELPSDPIRRNDDDEHPVGMTIWRLPGGGFAVGRFNAARRDGERALPVVLTEMDGGGLGNSEGPRRISWVRASRTPETEGNVAGDGAGAAAGGRLSRAVRGMVSLIRRMRLNNDSSSSSFSSNPLGLNSNGEPRVLNRSNSLIGRYFRRGRSGRESVLQ